MFPINWAVVQSRGESTGASNGMVGLTSIDEEKKRRSSVRSMPVWSTGICGVDEKCFEGLNEGDWEGYDETESNGCEEDT